MRYAKKKGKNQERLRDRQIGRREDKGTSRGDKYEIRSCKGR